MIDKIFKDQLFWCHPISFSKVQVHVFQLQGTSIKAFNKAVNNLQVQFRNTEFQQFKLEFIIIPTTINQLYEFSKVKQLVPKYKKHSQQDFLQIIPVLSNQLPLQELYQKHHEMMQQIISWQKTTTNKLPDYYKDIYKLNFEASSQNQDDNQLFFLFPQYQNDIKYINIEDIILNQVIGYNSPDIIIGIGQLDLTNPQISMLENQRNFNMINTEQQIPLSILDIQENSAFYLVDSDGDQFPESKLDYAFINQTEHKGGFLQSLNLYNFVSSQMQKTLVGQYQDLLKTTPISQQQDFNLDMSQITYQKTQTQLQFLDMFFPINKYKLFNYKFTPDIYGSYQLQTSNFSTSYFSLENKEQEHQKIFAQFPQLRKSNLKEFDQIIKFPTKMVLEQNYEPINLIIDYAKICGQLGLKVLSKKLLKQCQVYINCPIKKIVIQYLIFTLSKPSEQELTQILNSFQQDSLLLLKHGLVHLALQYLYYVKTLLQEQANVNIFFHRQLKSQFQFILQFSGGCMSVYKVASQFITLLKENSTQKTIITMIVFNQFLNQYNSFNSLHLKQFLFIFIKTRVKPLIFCKTVHINVVSTIVESIYIIWFVQFSQLQKFTIIRILCSNI